MKNKISVRNKYLYLNKNGKQTEILNMMWEDLLPEKQRKEADAIDKTIEVVENYFDFKIEKSKHDDDFYDNTLEIKEMKSEILELLEHFRNEEVSLNIKMLPKRTYMEQTKKCGVNEEFEETLKVLKIHKKNLAQKLWEIF